MGWSRGAIQAWWNFFAIYRVRSPRCSGFEIPGCCLGVDKSSRLSASITDAAQTDSPDSPDSALTPLGRESRECGESYRGREVAVRRQKGHELRPRRTAAPRQQVVRYDLLASVRMARLSLSPSPAFCLPLLDCRLWRLALGLGNLPNTGRCPFGQLLHRASDDGRS